MVTKSPKTSIVPVAQLHRFSGLQPRYGHARSDRVDGQSGLFRDEIYQAGLAFNSYWFGQTYMDLAYYFKTKENLDWKNVDPKVWPSLVPPKVIRLSKRNRRVLPKPKSGGGCGA